MKDIRHRIAFKGKDYYNGICRHPVTLSNSMFRISSVGALTKATRSYFHKEAIRTTQLIKFSNGNTNLIKFKIASRLSYQRRTVTDFRQLSTVKEAYFTRTTFYITKAPMTFQKAMVRKYTIKSWDYKDSFQFAVDGYTSFRIASKQSIRDNKPNKVVHRVYKWEYKTNTYERAGFRITNELGIGKASYCIYIIDIKIMHRNRGGFRTIKDINNECQRYNT